MLKFAFARPRIGITGKVLIGSLIIVVIGFLLFLSIARWIADSETEVFVSHEIHEAIADMDGDLTRENEDVSATANFLSSQTDLIDLVNAHDQAGLIRYLTPLVHSDIVDSITVADRQGKILARIGNDHAAQSQPETTLVLSGNTLSTLHPDTKQMLLSYSVPLYEPGTTTPLGMMTLSCFLDNGFLDLSMKPGRAERLIAYQGRVIASTINQPNGDPWVGQMLPEDVAQAESQGKSSGLVTLETDRGAYAFQFVPLETSNHTQVGMYGAGIAQDSLKSQRIGLLQAFGVGFLVVLGAMAIVGLVLARTLTTPIRLLQNAVNTMATGDLSKKIDVTSNDEFGDLTRQVEHLRQQLRQALDLSLHQQSRYAAAIHDMGVAALFTDLRQQITSVNAMGEQLLKQDETGLIGQSWDQVFVMNGTSDAAVPLSWNQLGPKNGTGSISVVRGRFPVRACPELVLEIVSSPVRLRDEVCGYIHVLQDVSAQEQFARSKDDFVLNVAHELRGPLSSLRVSVELLTEDYATMSKRDIGVMLRGLRKVIVKFQGLVESLVDVGNIQAGRFRVRPTATAVKALIDDVIEQVEPILEARDQSLDLHLEAEPEFVLADSSRIGQVLVNLLTNASKYGPDSCPISLSTSKRDGLVCFSVADRGDGISPEDQAQVFTRFFRIRRSGEEGSGIGLGLALAKGIIEAHGGTIHLESEPNRGTTFWFTLPETQLLRQEWANARVETGGLE